MDRLHRLFLESITMKGVRLIVQEGHRVSFGFLQLRLAAFEAGLGVYDRSGIIIHPVLGSRIRIGAIMTDAEMEPDGRLAGFEPCSECDRCVRMCPAHAYDTEKSYPESWSRSVCEAKRAEIAGKGLYCRNCYAVCPAGTMEDERLLQIAEALSFFRAHR